MTNCGSSLFVGIHSDRAWTGDEDEVGREVAAVN